MTAETLVPEGIATSIGGIGDAYDNALAGDNDGLFKTEAIARCSPFVAGRLRTVDDVEYATMEWIDCHNSSRPHSQLNYILPDEYTSTYYLTFITVAGLATS